MVIQGLTVSRYLCKKYVLYISSVIITECHHLKNAHFLTLYINSYVSAMYQNTDKIVLQKPRHTARMPSNYSK